MAYEMHIHDPMKFFYRFDHSSLRPAASRLIRFGTIGVFSLLSIGLSHAQTLIDFNSTGQLTGDFYATGFPVWSQASSGGLNNSGWAKSSTSSTTRGYEVQNQTFAGAVSFSLSAYFQWGPDSATSGDSLMLGAGLDTNPLNTFTPVNGGTGPLGSPTGQSLQFGLGARSTQNQVRLYGSSIVSGTNANSFGSTTATLSVGNWYYLQVDFSLAAGNTGYTVDVNLANSSNLGVVGSNVLTWNAGTFTNASLTAGDMHAFFGARDGLTSGVVGLDNFNNTAVPEPSTMATFLLGSLATFFWARRARCKVLRHE